MVIMYINIICERRIIDYGTHWVMKIQVAHMK